MGTSVVIVDSRVTDYQTLIDGLTEPAEVLVLNAQSDSLSQIATYLQGRSGIDALHIISHGSRGALQLGSTVLDSGNLGYYGSQLANIDSALTSTGDILLYGCNVAQGDVGLQFINSLAQYTGADVAASADLTGESGNWLLEQSTGPIDIAAIHQDDYVSSLYATTDSSLLVAAVNLAARAYSDAHYHNDAAKIGAINATLQGWTALSATDLGVTPDIGLEVANNHLFRYEYGNASATIGLTILDGKKTLGIAFEGTNFDTQPLDLWDDIVNISAHANKLNSLMTAVAEYVNVPGNGIEQVLVSGHSLGGSVAQEFMERYGSDARYKGATFGNPGTLVATSVDPSRFVNFSHTGDVVPYVGEYAVQVVSTGRTLLRIADEIKNAFKNAALATPAGVAAYAIDSVVDALRDKVLGSLVYATVGAYFELDPDPVKAAQAAQVGLTYAINRNDYTIVGTRVRFDLQHADDAIVGIAEHSLFDLSNEVNYTASLKTYLDYVGSGSSFQSGFYLMGTSAVDALQTAEVNAYALTFGNYTAILGAGGSDVIGEHTLLSNDNEPSVMAGGLGDDTYYFDNNADVVTEKQNEGTDTVYAYVSATLPANVENLLLAKDTAATGLLWFDKNISGGGNALDNVITGNDGNNTLHGVGGNDTLISGHGTDRLYGDAGDDKLVAIDGNDKLFGGTGNDTYQVSAISAGEYITGIGLQTYAITDDSGSLDVLRICENSSDSADSFSAFLQKLKFKAVGNDLYIDLPHVTGTIAGIIQVDFDIGQIVVYGEAAPSSSLETLSLYLADGTTQIGSDISLASVWHALSASGNAGTFQTLFTQTKTDQYGLMVVGDPYIYGTPGNDSLTGTTGSDTIVASLGTDTIDGGAGADTLLVQLDLSGSTGSGVSYFINGRSLNTSSSYDTLTAALDPIAHPTTSYIIKLGSLGSTTTTNVENFVVRLTSTSSDDLLIYQNGSYYNGGAGTDTFYANWSAFSDGVVWSNSQSGSQTSNGVTILGVERLLLVTGSGRDVISNTGVATDDFIVAGAGDDVINGGSGNDTLYGEGDNDRLYGGAGNDNLYGQAGNDSLYGGPGHDVLYGDAGNDYYEALADGSYGDTIVESNGGTDVLRILVNGASSSFTQFHVTNGIDLQIDFYSTSGFLGSVTIINMAAGASQVETLELNPGSGSIMHKFSLTSAWNWTLANQGDATHAADYSGGTAAYLGTLPAAASGTDSPTEGDDNITGSSGPDVIWAMGGNDTIDAQAGDDVIDGGEGEDWIRAGDGNDVVAGGAGNDTINAGVGSDRIDAGAGNDVISVVANWAETDTVEGGTGVNQLTVDASNIVASTTINYYTYHPYAYLLWSGLDAAGAAMSAVDVNSTMAAIQSLLTGADKLHLLTNSQAQGHGVWMNDIQNLSLIGSSKTDLLLALGSNGTYVGDAGFDTLYADWSAASAGITWINDPAGAAQSLNGTSISGVERLLITTGSGDDKIDNSYTGNTSNDEIITGAGNDTINAGVGSDRIDAGAGDDILDGGAGTDTLIGGSGNDTYVVDVLTDVITELTNEGIDTIQTGITYTLVALANVENLSLTGIATINGTGNTANNVLVGNSAANNLSADSGNDTLEGGLGNDTLIGGAGIDTAIFRGTRTQYTLTSIPTGWTLTGTDGIDTLSEIEFAQFSDMTLSLGNFAPSGQVTITGVATVGQTLTASNTLADVDGLGALSYQWQANGIAISGATTNTYVLTGSYVGKTITALASYTDGHGTKETVVSNSISLGTNVALLAYTWNTHTLLNGVNVSGASQSATTNSSGEATWSAVAGTSENLTANRTVPSAETAKTSAAVNLQDAIAILKMIVGLPVNGANQPVSPYQTLAADFDANGTVGLTDAIGVLKHVVGLPAPEPAWHFVSETDPGVPSMTTLSPGTPHATVTADLTGPSPVHVGLVGYLSGDVDGSYAGAAGALDLDVTQPTYIATLVANHPGLTVAQFGG